MRPALFTKFVDKAEAALVAAVEVYNKPGFRYREETFALLAINAWELLLKAKLLQESSNDPKVLWVYESRTTRTGKRSKRLFPRRNRSGNPLTKSLPSCVNALDTKQTARLSPEIKANLEALIAVRDGAAHYIHASPVLAKQVLEIASANVKNFIILARSWFRRDLSEALSLMLPLSFLGPDRPIDSVVVTAGEEKLLTYLQTLAATEHDSGSPYAVAVRLQIKFERSKLATASKVQISNDADAVKVFITEEDIRERYPWDYARLSRECANRFINFLQNEKYHEVRRSVKGDARYEHTRLLDPGNPNSGAKVLFSPAILEVFDKHYRLRLKIKPKETSSSPPSGRSIVAR